MRLAEFTNRYISAGDGRATAIARYLWRPPIDTTSIKTGCARMKSGLVNDVDFLLAEQIRNWPLLARGVESLRHAQTRAELVAGRELWVRHIPHRIGSTTAAVDAA